MVKLGIIDALGQIISEETDGHILVCYPILLLVLNIEF